MLQATGALDALIAGVVAAARGRGEVILPALMFLFAVGGGTIGMAEETLPFLPGLVLLARRLGYDEVVGGAIALVGAGAGFAGAFMNPFTVGVGQAIAGLPLFSGMGYRLIVWFVLTTVTIVYVSWYARRHRLPLAANPGPPASAGEPPGGSTGEPAGGRAHDPVRGLLSCSLSVACAGSGACSSSRACSSPSASSAVWLADSVATAPRRSS